MLNISPEFIESLERDGFKQAAKNNGSSYALRDLLISLPSQIRLKPLERKIEFLENKMKSLSAKVLFKEKKIKEEQEIIRQYQEKINYNDDRIFNQVGKIEEAPNNYKIALTALFTLCIGALVSIYTMSVSYAAFFTSPFDFINSLSTGGASLSELSIEGVLNKDVISSALEYPLVSVYVFLFGFLFSGVAWVNYHQFKNRNYLGFAGMTILILIIDLVLGYKISHDQFILQQMTGVIEEGAFTFNQLIESETFYLVLVSGLVTFFIFEKLFWLLLEELEKYKPKVSLLRENRFLLKQIEKSNQKIKKLEDQKSKLQEQILEISVQIDGSIPSFEALKEVLSAYVLGYSRFVIQSGEDVDRRLKRIESVYYHALKQISKSY